MSTGTPAQESAYPDLAAWLRAQLDVDEAIATAAAGPGYLYDCDGMADESIAHITAFDPARALATVTAFRRIVEGYETALVARDVAVGTPLAGATRMSLRIHLGHVLAIAVIYNGRPGYHEAVDCGC